MDPGNDENWTHLIGGFGRLTVGHLSTVAETLRPDFRLGVLTRPPVGDFQVAIRGDDEQTIKRVKRHDNSPLWRGL